MAGYINAAGQTQIDSLQARNQMAQALMAQALQPQQGADASTAIGKALAAYFGNKGLDKNTAAIQDIQNKAESDYRAEIARVMAAPTTQQRVTELAQSQNPDLQKLAIAQALTPPKLTKVSQGGSIIDANGKVVYQSPQQGITPYQQARIDQGNERNQILRDKSQGGGPFKGTSMDAQVQNILLQGDPATPEYAAAYALATQPRTMMTDQGLVTVTPQLPAAIRPPVMAGTAPAQQPAASAAPASPSPAPKVETIPGTEPLRSTETMRTAAGFLDRMTEAEKTIGGLQGKVDPTDPGQVASKSVPLVGNYFQSPEFQQYTQAADDWIRAKLRKESGAVIGDEEMAREYKNYFPMPGDSPQVIEQKAAARATAVEAMRGMSGNQAPAGGDTIDIDGVPVRRVK